MIIIRTRRFTAPAGGGNANSGSGDQKIKNELGLQGFDNNSNLNSFKMAADAEMGRLAAESGK